MEKNTTDNHPSRLAAWRRSRGLTQAQLAAIAGITRTSVSLIERGAVPLPRLRTAQKLAAALGATVEDLFPQEPESAVLLRALRVYAFHDESPAGSRALGRSSRDGSAQPHEA